VSKLIKESAMLYYFY